MEINKKKELTIKQRVLLYFYRSEQRLKNKQQIVKAKIRNFIDSLYFYVLFLGVIAILLHWVLIHFNIIISENNLHSFAFAVAGIIGASIAIIFSFSTFILQSTADLFSTQYLNKFINNIKERVFFWLLVFLTLASFLAPIFLKKYALEASVVILFVAFYLIYVLYKELRRRINPETTLIRIKADALKQLEEINKELRKRAHVQSKIFAYEKEGKDLSLDVQYKVNPNWHLIVLENVKYLFEIGLRLLAKNEINSFNLTIKYIHDIYLKHLALRSGHFIMMPASLWGTYLFNDEGFTTKILEYLQSIGDRIIQEKRKENIYYLLKIYENILAGSLNVGYADKASGLHGENPLIGLILVYYIGFLEKLLKSKESDWVWESIKSVSSVSNYVLQKTDDYFIYSQINQVINKISISSALSDNQETFLKELVGIYFNQIRIAWDKYEHNDIFWGHLLEELKKNIILLSASSRFSLSVSDLFINFHTWQGNVTNQIIDLEGEKEKKKYLDKFTRLLDRWSNFLLDFAGEVGLQNKQVGLSIIQSIDNNLRIIYVIRHKFGDVDLRETYQTQFNVLGHYFQKTEKVEESFLFNFEQVLEILLKEISYNLKHGIFNIEHVINLYIKLIEQHFEKATLGYGYNHPRIIEKLVYLGLFLHKYKKTGQEEGVIVKIDELNKKYLELNKDFFELKQKEKNLMGPDEFQLCKELYDLENDLFSYSRGHLMDLKNILKEEITKDEWVGFTKKINHCKDIKYETRHVF